MNAMPPDPLDHPTDAPAAVPLPPEIDPGDVPFEEPKRFHRIRKVTGSIRRRREKPLSPAAIGAFVLVYALGAAGVGYMASGLLLFAWLMAGPLAITVYLTLDGRRGSLLNPYTIFFAVICLAAVLADIAGR